MLKRLPLMVLLLLFYTAAQGWSMTQSGSTTNAPSSSTGTAPAGTAQTQTKTPTTPTPQAKAAPSGGAASSATGQNKTSTAGSARTVTAVSYFTVENIILQKIDQGMVYSADGRTFPLSSGTRIIRNIQDSKMRVAELMFINGVLISVLIR